MKKVYLIKIGNGVYEIAYSNYDIAKRNLNRLIQRQYYDLLDESNGEREYYIIDYVEDKEESCEREIWVKTDNEDKIYIRYAIFVVELEDENVRYDEEEDFPINEELLKEVNGMIYKGIYVSYLVDTNTLLFTIYKENGEYDDYDDIDCMVFRNYDKAYIEEHIEKLLKLDYVINRIKK